MSLTNEPSIIGNLLELSFNSTIFSRSITAASFPGNSIQNVSPISKQIQMLLSENVINIAFISLQTAQYFDFNMNSKLTVKYFKLDTTYLRLFISNLS